MQPFWPLKLDYLIIALDPDYQWTAIGVPNQRYLWVMARSPHMADKKLGSILEGIKQTGYKVKDVKRVPHNKQKSESP